jgi:hypothetical protein
MKYPKIYRIPVKDHRVRGKNYLSSDDVSLLLSSRIIVEEKIDGKLLPIMNIMDEKCVTYYYEYVKYKHNIFYNNLPGSTIGIDIHDSYLGFLPPEEKNKLFGEIGKPVSPILYEGICNLSMLLSYMGTKSRFSDSKIEGIVIKNYKFQMFGKIVDPDFDNEVDDSIHWSRKPLIENIITGE